MIFTKRINKDNKIVLLMLCLALIGLIFLLLFSGFSIWFWILSILWILFALIFYFRLFAFISVTITLTWIIFVILLALTITFSIAGRNSAHGKKVGPSNAAQVPCTSDGSDSPVQISGWNGRILSKTIDATDDNDTGIRTFSIKNLDAKTGQSLYYRLEKSGGGYVAGAKGLIEVCDSNNMTEKHETTKYTTTTPASQDALAVTYYLHGNKRVTNPGTYRIDAWANIDGDWKLVDRANGVEFTE